MDTGIIISIIFGAASIISSICFGLIPGVRRQKIIKLEDKCNTLMHDIDSLVLIEKRLIEELPKSTGKNQETIKREIRKEVREQKDYKLSQYTKPSAIQGELS